MVTLRKLYLFFFFFFSSLIRLIRSSNNGATLSSRNIVESRNTLLSIQSFLAAGEHAARVPNGYRGKLCAKRKEEEESVAGRSKFLVFQPQDDKGLSSSQLLWKSTKNDVTVAYAKTNAPPMLEILAHLPLGCVYLIARREGRGVRGREGGQTQRMERSNAVITNSEACRCQQRSRPGLRTKSNVYLSSLRFVLFPA